MADRLLEEEVIDLTRHRRCNSPINLQKVCVETCIENPPNEKPLLTEQLELSVGNEIRV